METYEAIMTRRSVPKVEERRPDRETVRKLLDAAVRAPTHHLTQPWRFVVLAGAALKGLGAAWAEGVVAHGKNPEGILAKATRAPVVMCVIETPKGHLPKVVELEEHYATGAAMQNILLAAHDLGLGAMLRSGPGTQLEEVRAHLGVSAEELIAGFIYLGYPLQDADARPMTRRTEARALTEWRGWD